MMRLRSIHLVLVTMISVLLIAQTAPAASKGKGGKGGPAAVGIDAILLINPAVSGNDILAEIGGGGFLGGTLEVTLDGVLLDDFEAVSAEMIVATIPGSTADGNHEIVVSTGDTNKESATQMIRLGGQMVVSCISWFVSGPEDEHLHTEVHVEDQDGNAVIGATVTWEAGNDTVGIYQTNVAPKPPTTVSRSICRPAL